MARIWTRAQNDAIYARGGELLISAAAGSGKTAVLVERVVTLLTDKESPVLADRILVVTFTNAAADEMRQRIIEALNERIQKEPDNEFLFHQRLLLSKASIGTIHAFCNDVIRHNFQLLNLAPDFRIADETELGLLRSSAMEEVLEEFYASEKKEFLDLVEFFCYKDDRALVEAVFQVYDFIRSHPFPLLWLKEKCDIYRKAIETGENVWLSVIWKYLNETLTYAKDLCLSSLKALEDDEVIKKNYIAAFESDLTIVDAVSEQIQKEEWDDLYTYLSKLSFAKLKPLRGCENDALKKQIQAKRDEFKSVINHMAQLVLSCSDSDGIHQDLKKAYPMIQQLFSFVEIFYLRLEEKKREKNVLDFSDLELFMMQLLWKESDQKYQKSELAQQLSKQYDQILVDEYQDTNEVQEAIFTAISCERKNLFMVGDVKQSIYRFRKAMPEIFIEKSRQFSLYDAVHFPAKIQLDRNFRSRAEVTGSVNYFFKLLMSPELGEVDYQQEQLVAQADYPPSDVMQTELHIIDRGGERYEEDEITYEARHIAYEIRRMIAQGVQVQDHGKQRRCEYRDFCILIRSVKEKAGRYVEELKKQGINTWANTTLGYFDSMEITLILNLLRILDNPLQDIPLLSVVMSPVFGFTPDDMAQIRIQNRSMPLHLAFLDAAKNGNKKVEKFLAITDDLRKYSVTAKISHLIQRIFDRTDFIAVVASTDTGEQREANLRLFLEYANTYEQAGYKGLSGFIHYIDRTIERGQDFESANVLSEHSNAVKIMSIHKSKGLEFPICFLANLSKPFNLMDTKGDLLLHPKLGIGCKIREPEYLKKYVTLPYQAEAILTKQSVLSEELRVLYVAMTRPKEKLVLLISDKNLEESLASMALKMSESELSPYLLQSASSYAQWLLMAALHHPEMEKLRIKSGKEFSVVPDTSELSLKIFPPITEQQAEELIVETTGKIDDKLKQQLQEMIDFTYPYQQQTTLAAKLSVTQVVKESVPSNSPSLLRPSFLQKDGFSAMEKGTIFHRFLQYCDFRRLYDSPEEETKRLLENGYLTLDEYEVLDFNRIKSFVTSDLLHRILQADEVYREFRFISEIPASVVFEEPDLPDDKIQIQGMADCVLVEQDGLIIIDYKTDSIKNVEELCQKYRRQLELYAMAISESFCRQVKGCFLYSIYLAESIEIKLKK